MILGILFLGMIALALISGLRWQATENHRIRKEDFKAKLNGTYYRGYE